MADAPEKTPPGDHDPEASEASPEAEEGRSPSGADKRQHPRARLSLLVQYRFASFDEFLGEYASDLSLGGMFIRTDEPRPSGSMIYLQFSLKDGSTLIEGLGRVCHVTEPGGERPAGMGIEFVNFDEASRELIEGIVEGHLLDGGEPEIGDGDGDGDGDGAGR
ncbi:MAG: TIGR02266 family protein [Deltaproteobacteria bacterium]|nr:TIGR02266 family protein [Deltaproteobacteria bacterium]